MKHFSLLLAFLVLATYFPLAAKEPDSAFAAGGSVGFQEEYTKLIKSAELIAPYGAPMGEYRNGTGYTGHAMDAATQLSYMQQRYYNPQLGRFLSVDPIATDPNTGDNFNRYTYANNNTI